MSRGYVYILSNEAMPGLVKIGRTTRSTEARAAELYQTGVPMPFKVEHQVLSPDCLDLEARMHAALSTARVCADREFFMCSIESARDMLDMEHVGQLSDWVAQYTENHALIEKPYFIEPSDIGEACSGTDAHPFEFADATRFLDPIAVQSAVNRSRARNSQIMGMPDKASPIQ